VFLGLSVSECLFFCLSAKLLRSSERILMKVLEGWGHGPKTNSFDFGGDPDRDLDPRIFQGYV